MSQVYGGGGNSGASFRNDFVELFNRGNTSVDLSGWSVQYASAGGTSWQATNLSGTVQPGHYYLVQEAAGSGGTTNLPTPDATGNINMSATAGKVALVNTTTAMNGSGCPFGATVVDFVGFGSGTTCSETSAAPAPSNTNAIQRAASGCTDTDNNSADFVNTAPNPRNSNSSSHLCASAGQTIDVNFGSKSETLTADSQAETIVGCAQTKAGVGCSQIEFGSSQTETGAGLFVYEGPPPLSFVTYLFEDFSAQRPRGGLTRWRRVAGAYAPRGTRGVPPRPRGAWP
ncbi:MAG: hypothetical protein DMF65_06325 [Acidobacteria bacterium]|nr:MAG: hypothetical protein DMF65_06325 [Acidobacteriota bacterium]